MFEVSLTAVLQRAEEAIGAGDFEKAETILLPALDQFPQIAGLWFHAGNLYFSREQPAMAMACYERGLTLEANPIVLSNLGACYRRMNNLPKAIETLEEAVSYLPEDVSALSNLCSCYVNEGRPQEGIPYARKALEIQPAFDRAAWNLGLLLLESGEFKEGFEMYRRGLGKERLIRSYSRPDLGPEPILLNAEIHAANKGQGKTLIVWGEQGIGDELLFAAAIYELKQDYRVILDCHPRLESIHRRTHPDIKIYGTRKEEFIEWPITDQVKADFKCPIGDLYVLYRQSREDFTRAWVEHGPYYPVVDGEREVYRDALTEFAHGRKIVGLATRGGAIRTMRDYRVISKKDLAPLFSDPGLCFVSFDYEDVSALIEGVNKEYGADKMMAARGITTHFDYEHTAALVAATDVLVTVCQSVAHLSASIGHPTLVLVPDRPAWRYGLTESRWFLYDGDHVELLRQREGQWPISELMTRLSTATTAAPSLGMPITSADSTAVWSQSKAG